ncbi:unnamed protein product [Schistosoma mattheei]|uniref:Uncharacterized protein n=1 Tax=Schistosoma mattheei TaxID=31246 RepID=A0A183Q4H7_9TREM|nr:unnamed protein product [Schistosoma mattheei]
MGLVVIGKGIVLRLLQHLRPDKFGGLDDIRLRTMKAPSDVIAGRMTILFGMSLRQFGLPRD